MPVIVGTRLFDKSPARPFHRVSVVETQNPPIAGIVQRQFIPNAMGPRLVGLDDPRADLDPVLRPDADIRSVQIKKNG
ncbi:MAG: hypothetical protein A3G26_06695 [Betaproteobacteria bacterium RIFCSPLOWO2_12_FULL_65_110]|nr:MAG: hypothetical protein A3G26_06695 [Betaproteobacteria bacterium RIFCSPLOWO2_12_FULL_65_110]